MPGIAKLHGELVRIENEFLQLTVGSAARISASVGRMWRR